MADYINRGLIPESTYYFSAEFEPSYICIRICYLIMVWIAASVLMLIVEKETVYEEDFCEERPKKSGGEADNYEAAFEVEDRGCQSPRILTGS